MSTEATRDGDVWAALEALVVWMDADLDGHVAERYKDQPLGQDWARVSKVAEEVGEAIDALIGITGQNPRKGQYGDLGKLLDELADVTLTGLYAIQHFTKDGPTTMATVFDRARHHRQRREDQMFYASLTDEERSEWQRRIVGAVPDA